MTEISIFDGQHKLHIDKPLRLIELFAGYGSQRLALDYLGVPYESQAISEWTIKSIQAYKDMHEPDDNNAYDSVFTDAEIRNYLKGGKISRDYCKPMTDDQIDKMSIDEARQVVRNMFATGNLGSVSCIDPSRIRLEDKYMYLCTYSFPCQDLSNAGKRLGADKGSGTRSSLLWEVERLLHGWQKQGRVPDILLMENVPEVVGKRNRAAWEQWILTLDQMGYKSYWKIINAVNFGIPQNRRRCFMVSVQGDYYYEFPESIGCDIRLRDVLEPIEKVDESYYLSDELIASYMKWSDRHQLAGDGFCFRPTDRDGADKAWCISTKAGSREGDNFIDENGSVCHKVGDLFGMGFEHMFEQSRRVYGNDGAAPTIHTTAGSETSHKEIKILVKANNSKGYDEMTDGDALDVRYPSSKTRRGRVGHGVAQTVQTDGGENQAVCAYDAYNHRDISVNETAGTITTNTPTANKCGTFYVGQPPRYRIRKLTERECFRLMGVKDEDSDRVAKNQVKTSMYHLPGDSIVTACLMAIMGEMFDVDWRGKIKELQESITNGLCRTSETISRGT